MKCKAKVIGTVIGCAVVVASTAYATVGSRTAELFYNNIKIMLNGKEVVPTDGNGNTIEPFIIDGTTYLPVRGVASALGLDVGWDAETSTVVLTDKDDTSNNEKVLLDNEIAKVSFIEIYEEEYLPGTCYLKLRVENKTDKKITVYTKDAYVNDTSVLLASGVPMVIEPGKASQNPFFFTYKNIGIDTKDAIQTIEFKLSFDNDESMVDTESLLVEVK